MRAFLKWLGVGLAAILVVALGVAVWKQDEIRRLLAVNSLFSEDRIVHNFSHMDGAFLHVPVPRGDGPVSPLPQGAPMTMPDGFGQWSVDRALTSIVVLHDGRIVHEDYLLGTTAEDRRISWSVAKSYLSALVGVLLAEGALPSIDVAVTDYVPALKGTAYDGVRLVDLLTMQSGVLFDEDYLNYDSDINRMGRAIALGQSLDSFTEALTARFQDPGVSFKYVSIDTHVIGMVVRGATGRSIADLLSEKIIAPLGLEADPYYVTDGAGAAFVLGGLNMRARDYARFGLMFEQDGQYQGKQVVPADWVDRSTRPQAKTAEGKFHYGYQWWMPADPVPGEFFGQGVYGQYLWIDQNRNVVIAINSADRGFRTAGVRTANIAMMRAISAAAAGR